MNFTKSCHLAACLGIFSLGLPTAEASVLVDYHLGGTENLTTVWTTLNNTNTAKTPDSGTGTLTVGSPGFQASSGLYSFAGDYSVTVNQSSTIDIQNVVFQLAMQPNPDTTVPFSGGPILTITTTAGAVQLAADLFAVNSSEVVNTTMGAGTFTGYAWQWDLSGYADTITSVSVYSPIAIHSSVIGAQIDTSSSSAVLVPEPSTVLVSVLGCTFLACRRRRH